MVPVFTPQEGRLGLAVAAVGAASLASFAVFSAVGEPFGTLNDVGNAAIGILAGGLAWRLRARPRWSGRTRTVATSAAFAGAAVTVLGSALVISRTTGWFLAGLVSTLGYAGIGVWLVACNWSLRRDGAAPRRLTSLGIAAGALMAVGFLTIPGIAARYDDAATAPGWIWLTFAGWLGIVLMLAWDAWLARLARPAPGRLEAAAR